jgi:hypothetical protein
VTRTRNARRLASYWHANLPARVVEPAGSEPAPVEAVAPPVAVAIGELRHGYTLCDLHHAARLATHTDRSHSASDYTDRLATAWYGIVEHLYAATDPVARHDLVRAGRDALQRETQSELSHRGVSYHYGYAEMRNFHRYWWFQCRPTPSCEDRVVDRQAVTQIWPHLRPVDQEALLALAAHDDYARAARALGVKYHTFAAAVRRARLHFLDLWHQGEAPSKPWGRDRRAAPGGAPVSDQRLTATRGLHRRTQMARRKAATT